jgi:beta-galactosidase
MITRVEGLVYGADYNPEQWPESVWEQDADLMRDAGVNMMTLGVFSWARLQPSEDEWDFGWLDRLMDLLHAHGISVDLATASASPPAWFVRQYPETLPVTADGVRLEFGSRQHYCPSSGVYREAATRLARTIAERYKDHPALALWHIHNEYGDHVTECFCEVSAEDFRRWLRERYGDITQLNFAWGTEFWAQRYSDFGQIEPPRRAPGPINPGQLLDWRRFSSDALLACFLAERAVLKEVTPEVPVTTNFMSMMKDLDYWKWAAQEDLVSDDAYPDPADRSAHIGAAMNYDLMRSLGGGQPWLLMEQAPSAVSWREVNVPKTWDQRRLWSLQTVARGADGVMHFQWRASRAGAEKFHSALLPHGGTRTRGWRDTVRLGEELKLLAEVAGSRIESAVAIILDWNSWWGLEAQDHPSARVRLKEQILSWYSVLHRWNHTVDFVPPDADLAGYKVVLAPNLYSVSAENAVRLSEYVRDGGHLVVGFFSGIVDELDHIHQGTDGSGGGYPGPLKELLGVAVDEWWPIPDGHSVNVAFTADEESAKAKKKHSHSYSYTLHPSATRWSEWLATTTAETVAYYGPGPLKGRPAVTCNEFGSGRAWYVSCDLGGDIEKVLGEAVRPAVVWPSLASTFARTGVEVVCRGSESAFYYFLLNHTDEPVQLGSAVPFGAVNLLTGNRPTYVAAQGVAVLKVGR